MYTRLKRFNAKQSQVLQKTKQPLAGASRDGLWCGHQLILLLKPSKLPVSGFPFFSTLRSVLTRFRQKTRTSALLTLFQSGKRQIELYLLFLPLGRGSVCIPAGQRTVMKRSFLANIGAVVQDHSDVEKKWRIELVDGSVEKRHSASNNSTTALESLAVFSREGLTSLRSKTQFSTKWNIQVLFKETFQKI